mgnify:CR=1 FL=1
MAEEKTNVMRILDQKRVPYTPHHYAHPNGAVDGASVAALLDRDPASVCKTLVTQGASRQHYVFIIPVLRSLDLKAAARAVGEKSIEMILSQATPSHRLRPRGLLPGGDEKAFSHRAGRERGRTGRHRGQRRENRSPGGAGSGSLCALVGGTFAPDIQIIFPPAGTFLRLLV